MAKTPCVRPITNFQARWQRVLAGERLPKRLSQRAYPAAGPASPAAAEGQGRWNGEAE